jgi:FtsH-binding integral membrane protein
LAIAVIFCAVIFGFDLGLWFSFALLGLASAYIIYDTSNIMHHYAPHQYVGAALELFASVALLFRVILRIMMESRRN